MIIRSAEFIKSSQTLKHCPAPTGPEFAFIGRSNVGKSSLINMLAGRKRLAKISADPGKTRTINHFLINETILLADLPGYGYARVPLSLREKWIRASREYLLKRSNLVCLFVLIDSRLKPQQQDIGFMEFLGINSVPFARIFTKCDKISKTELKRVIRSHDAIMLDKWESLPLAFTSSSVTRAGREDILSFMEETINKLSN